MNMEKVLIRPRHPGLPDRRGYRTTIDIDGEQIGVVLYRDEYGWGSCEDRGGYSLGCAYAPTRRAALQYVEERVAMEMPTHARERYFSIVPGHPAHPAEITPA